MNEYEYEVTFMGTQWRATVLCYHEHDLDSGPDTEGLIESWALAVANETSLTIDGYHSVQIEKTGVLVG